jgi:hypothetical protein
MNNRSPAITGEDRISLSVLKVHSAFAVRRAHRVQRARDIAHVDHAIVHQRRRFVDAVLGAIFPAQLAGGQVDGQQIGGFHAHVNGAIGDGRRRLNSLAGFVGPQQLERAGNRAGGHARQLRIAAKLRPLVRRMQASSQKDCRRQSHGYFAFSMRYSFDAVRTIRLDR